LKTFHDGAVGGIFSNSEWECKRKNVY
jgi:hypothetical protein